MRKRAGGSRITVQGVNFYEGVHFNTRVDLPHWLYTKFKKSDNSKLKKHHFELLGGFCRNPMWGQLWGQLWGQGVLYDR